MQILDPPVVLMGAKQKLASMTAEQFLAPTLIKLIDYFTVHYDDISKMVTKHSLEILKAIEAKKLEVVSPSSKRRENNMPEQIITIEDFTPLKKDNIITEMEEDKC